MYSTYRTNKGIFTCLSTEEIISSYISGGVAWEDADINICNLLIQKTKNSLDIGSHIGCYAVPLSVSSKMVYAFEAQPEMYNLLLQNLVQNKVHNVVPFCAAVGHKDDVEVSISDRANDGRSRGKLVDYQSNTPVNYGGMQIGPGKHPVPLMSIDRLGLTNVGFMKVDVEGFEPLVFYGAMETIKKEKPTILYENNWKKLSEESKKVVEINDDAETFDINQYTKSLGYGDPIRISPDNLLLVRPYRGDLFMRGSVKFQGDEISINGDTLNLGQRGTFPVRWLSETQIFCFFSDQKQAYIGNFNPETKQLEWSNKTAWKIAS